MIIKLLFCKHRYNWNQPGLVTFLNPYSYLLVRNYYKLLSSFNGIFLDGIVFVLFIRLFLRISCERTSFDMTSLAKIIFEFAENKGKSIYFIGTKEPQISEAVNKILKTYPRLIISGYRNGFFTDTEERANVIKNIYSKSPDIVVVGMGTPIQEQFLVDLWQFGWRGIGFTCGGFFHQTAKGLDYYPRWMDRLHLRWLYRIYDEPKLFKRYLFQYPKFILYFLFDYTQYILKKG